MIQQQTVSQPSCTPSNQHLDPLDDNMSSIALVRVSGSDVDVVNAARVSYGKVVTIVKERDKKLNEEPRSLLRGSSFPYFVISSII